MTNREKKYIIINKIQKLRNRLDGCIEFPFFGASYPDASCIDGYLWDLDSGDGDGLTNGGSEVCPVCHTREYIQQLIDNQESLERIFGHMKYIFTRYGRFKN